MLVEITLSMLKIIFVLFTLLKMIIIGIKTEIEKNLIVIIWL